MKQMNTVNALKEKGFSILSVILVIVAVIISLSVWAVSGSTNSSNNSANADVLASTIINDGVLIKTAYDKLLLDGANSSNIVFVPNQDSTTNAPNMLDPVKGITVPQLNTNALRLTVNSNVPEGIWVYNAADFRAPYVGTPTINDPTILVSGLKDSVCLSINKTLHGIDSIPVYSGVSMGTMFTQGATKENPQSVANIFPFILGTVSTMYWSRGCVAANGVKDNNMYFMVLQAK